MNRGRPVRESRTPVNTGNRPCCDNGEAVVRNTPDLRLTLSERGKRGPSTVWRRQLRRVGVLRQIRFKVALSNYCLKTNGPHCPPLAGNRNACFAMT